MTTETVGGATMVPPTSVTRGRAARVRQLAPFPPAGLILVGLFFVPLAVMLVFSFWSTDERLNVVPVFTAENYANFFENPTYVRTLLKTLIMGLGVTIACVTGAVAVAYFLARYVSRRWARLALL